MLESSKKNMADKKLKLVVCLSGGSPWGFRLQGGAGTGLPLVVSKVRRKSRSHRRLQEGDTVLSVNDRSTDHLTYEQVMDIVDTSDADTLTLEVVRQESNKENVKPETTPTARTSSPMKMSENHVIKEVISEKEIKTEVTKETNGVRIKSATLLPDIISFPPDMSLSSSTVSKLTDDFRKDAPLDPFPEFSELLQSMQGPPKPSRMPTVDSSTSSRVEEVKTDDTSVVKTSTETKHEVKGNTETSFVKKETESVSTSCDPKMNIDSLDLNELINATQRTLDSFNSGFKSDYVDVSDTTKSSFYEVKKAETKTTTSNDIFSSINSSPFSCGTLQDIDFGCNVVRSKQDTIGTMLPGFQLNSSETSRVTSEDPFGSDLLIKKKKMFTSSSFYEEPGSLYPTVEEQVEMARKIADSLAADSNRKSKGSNMFIKRVKKSSKWIHEGPDPEGDDADVIPVTPGVEPPTPDPSQVPFRPSKGPPSLKLVLDQRHPMDLTALRSSGLVISEHNVVSPEVCHGIVKDLHSPVGKGAALFAKRRQKAEDWVVDEQKVRALMREQEKKAPAPPYNHLPNFNRAPADVRLVRSPWDAAMESPLGLPDAAFARTVHPDVLADTVIRAADSKRTGFSPPSTPQLQDIYRAKPPKGWAAPEVMSSSVYSPPPAAYSTSHENTSQYRPDNGPRKMVYQNFNTLPRLWKGVSG